MSCTNTGRLLPPGFATLEPFVEDWAGQDFQSRYEARYRSDPAALRSFYDTVQPKLEAALKTLETQPLHDMDEPHRQLFSLVMAAAHVAVAVERHGQPRPANTLFPNSLRVVRHAVPA